MRQRPALEALYLSYNPFGDEGLAALMPPPPPAGTPPPPAGGLKQLKVLYLCGTQITDAGCATLAASHFELLHLERLGLSRTQITDAGCATLAAALDSGVLPALEELKLDAIPASGAATDAVYAAMKRSRARAAFLTCWRSGYRWTLQGTARGPAWAFVGPSTQ